MAPKLCCLYLLFNFGLSEGAGVVVCRFVGHVFVHDVGQAEGFQNVLRPVHRRIRVRLQKKHHNTQNLLFILEIKSNRQIMCVQKDATREK